MVRRSGVESNENPLYNTKEYYPDYDNARVGSQTNHKMHSSIKFPSVVEAQSQAQKPKSKIITPGFQIPTKKTAPKFQGILVERFRKALHQRGSNTILGLGRAFKIADDNNSGALSFSEFEKAVRDFGLVLDPLDVQGLFKSIDLDQSGEIDFNEFLRVVAGEMNPFRRNLVERAFRSVDVNNDGAIDIQEVFAKYDPSASQDVRNGKKTPE